ncbi:MAG: SGNH/GDSL hydrolase family protein [Polaribacter sp.]|jgi:hypothetical protein|nr:SGNH/GDSL hydrolase family protein [Polaribacter sp.]MBT5099505.1 SGNH/GDSL hydrolase family protein [Polaribacter sp.]MBT7705047.1 SGNH/GDSL hydrolase family protein [Polaribacter sp.]
MKNYKYIGLLLMSLGLVSCDVDNELEVIEAAMVEEVALNTNGLDFSNYVSVGASFTSGYTDGALFIAAQESSFPNILAGKFGTDFTQPLMNDNIGGMVFGPAVVLEPRLYFNGAGPARLDATPTTQFGQVISGPFNNMGIPGAKSFHLGVPGYGALNPYFGRMASSPGATVLGDALAQSPTFFTLSEIGGNDVLGYATSGGAGVDQTGNFNPATYGGNDITDPNVFASVFSDMTNALTANGAKGVVGNVPYVTSLPYFTTVPHNPIPLDAGTAGALNAGYAPYNGGLLVAQSYAMIDAAEVAKRTINFVEGQNAVVIVDEDLTDLSALGIPSYRQATANDLLVLTSSSFIGTLADPSNPNSVNGVGVPLANQWVLTDTEQAKVKTATDAYNMTIEAVAAANPNLALVDLFGFLQEASTGIQFDEYVMNTSLVMGGLVSLDGVHLTGRGYALMANKILAAMDAEFGSNFTTATGGLAIAGDYTTNYSPSLR